MRGTGRRSLTFCAALCAAYLAASPASATLPDGRAYEQVSPAEKNAGVGVVDQPVFGMAMPDGDRVFYKSLAALPGSMNGRRNDYEATRASGGWRSDALLPTSSLDPNFGARDALNYFNDISADGRTVLYDGTQPLDPDDQDQLSDDLYLRKSDGAFLWVSRGTLNQGTQMFGTMSGVLSADGTHVVFLSPMALLPEDSARTAQYGLYDWHAGELRLVAVDSGGTLLSTTANQSLGANVAFETSATGLNPVSRDGSKIFFNLDGRLYVRIDATTTEPLTPNAGSGDAQRFMGATPDGSFAYFTSNQRLAPNDTDNSVDLYRYRVSDGSYMRVSSGAGHSEQNADVRPVGVQVSEDGSRVYFVAAGHLTPDAPAVYPGAVNLYLRDGSQTRFIAQVLDGELSLPPSCPVDSNWRTTADGNHLLIATRAALDPNDVDGSQDLYVFSVSSGVLALVSDGISGGDAAVDVPMASSDPSGASCPPHAKDARAITDDGRYVFFETSESLVPEDTNTVTDVYEHDLDTGTTSLLSAGTGDHNTWYMDSSVSGRDVFFGTFDALAASDIDSKFDVYDVRVGGGFPTPVARQPCSGDACQDAASAQLTNAQPPASAGVHETPTEAPTTPSVSIRALTAAQRRALARGRTAKLLVTTTTTGTLRLHGIARMGGVSLTAVRGSAKATAGRVVAISIRLLPTARKQLRRHGDLAITLIVTLAPGPATKALKVRLTAHLPAHQVASRR